MEGAGKHEGRAAGWILGRPLRKGVCAVSYLRFAAVVTIVLVVCAFTMPFAVAGPIHTADRDGDRLLALGELLRVIQFFNSDGVCCDAGSEDGYAPGSGDQGCTPHDADYAGQDWRVNLSELLRLVQFFNSDGYCRFGGTEDGFAPATSVGTRKALGGFYLPTEGQVTPDAPGYTLPLDLATVTGHEQIESILAFRSGNANEAAALFEQHGFVIVGYGDCDDIAVPYENLTESGVPVFVTSDTLLHLYHIQFDETLKTIEEETFYGDIGVLTEMLLADALVAYDSYSDDLKEAARRNVAYLAVARKLLDPAAAVPALVSDAVAGELAKIDAHGGFAASDIFLYEEDYSQYVPRGHYTRSETLERYFRALMWYGRMAFLMKGSDIPGDALLSAHDARIQTLQAVMLALAIDTAASGEQSARAIWDRIYDVTSFYVGLADDLTPYEYLEVANRLFGNGFSLALLEDEATFFDLKSELALLRSPQIYGGTGRIFVPPPVTSETLNQTLRQTKGMRLFGQRFVPDSYMLQRLVFSQVQDYTGDRNPPPFSYGSTGGRFARCYPRGLDVMAILGSAEARSILIEEGDTEYVDYETRYAELAEEFASFDEEAWNRNLYWSWLYALKALVVEFPEGYPNFMRTDAWERKELNAALASWTQLRHDTILYAKQSYGEEESEPPEVMGYVEPVPEFYGRLLALASMTRRGLVSLEAISPEAEARMSYFEDTLERLIAISNKELLNLPLSFEDYEYIKYFGGVIEWLTLGDSEGEGGEGEGEGESNPGAETTLVADVHTHSAESTVVEEGVGYVELMLTAFSAPSGEIRYAAGPVLSYYEFKQPMADRLTDEAWCMLLDSPECPARPLWFQGLRR